MTPGDDQMLRFPTGAPLAALAGAQPKLALVRLDGVYRSHSPDELRPKLARVEAALEAMVRYCRMLVDTGAAEEPVVALLVALDVLRSRRWFTDAQNLWLLRRAAEQLEWQPLQIEAGRVPWFECEDVPYSVSFIGPRRPPPLTRVQALMQAAQRRSAEAP